MRRPYQITGCAFLFLAGFTATESLRLRYYTPLGPGPGFFAFWLACVLAVLAIVVIGQATFGATEQMPSDFVPEKKGGLRVGAVVVALVATAALLNLLGFRMTMLAVNLFLLTVLGRHSLILTLLVSLAGSFGVFHVFSRWLMVPLPVGVFGL